MTNKFEGKTALITGAGSGIGQSTAIKLAKEGAHVLIVDLDLEAANYTKEMIEVFGGLINNAGIAHVGNLENTSEDDLDRLYNVNVKGTYNFMSATIGSMKKNKSGVIINLASVASSVGIADRFAYSMSKGAVLTMTYSVAKDYINDGIRCNCIAPGRVHTPFVDNFLEKNYPDDKEEMFEKLSKSQPIGRMGKVDEISGLILYLCSDDAAFITGSNFPIDGGFVTLNN